MAPAVVYDIKHVKAVVTLLARIYAALKGAKSDGKIDATDIQYLLPVFMTVGPALEDVKLVIPELKDLTITEKDELVGLLKTEVPDLANDLSTLEKVSACLDFALALKRAYAAFSAVKTS